MVTVRFRALSALAVAGAALLLSACGERHPASPAPARADAADHRLAPARPRPTEPATPHPGAAGAGVHPGPTGIPVGTGRPVTVDGMIEAGVEPGCKVLTAGSTTYLMLGGKDVPIGVPVRVDRRAAARGFEHLPAGDAAAGD